MKDNKFLHWGIPFVIGVLLAVIITNSFYKKKQSSDNEKWQKLCFVLSSVEENYVDSVDRTVVTDAALESALQKLDPHSVYLRPDDLKSADDDLAGAFEGVGLVFNVPNDTATVLSVVAGGPSEKAGLVAGDKIMKVDEHEIAGRKVPQDTMVRYMRGPKGTRVVLTILRGDETIPFDIVRDKIPEHSVDTYFMLNDTTGYIHLGKFSRTTYEESANAMDALAADGMKKLIFDLRGNSGGMLDQVCLLANEFLPKDALIVYMEGLHRKREEVKADGRGFYQDLDVSILIDDSSASASEILAGAIQDNDRGIIVGRRSFGKGLVQEPMYFSDGSGVRVTVARFHTPSGRCIQKPYADDYEYDYYNRYASGELFNADSIKTDSSKVYKTLAGRTVYGGGGIIPDIFVPIDTTKVTDFYSACVKKALSVRFAAKFIEKHRALIDISDYGRALDFLDACDVENEFIAYAASQDVKLKNDAEWKETREYLMPQLRGLVIRYSKVGETAYYKSLVAGDPALQKAISSPARP